MIMKSFKARTTVMKFKLTKSKSLELREIFLMFLVENA